MCGTKKLAQSRESQTTDHQRGPRRPHSSAKSLASRCAFAKFSPERNAYSSRLVEMGTCFLLLLLHRNKDSFAAASSDMGIWTTSIHAKSTLGLGSTDGSRLAVDRRALLCCSSIQALPHTKPLTFLTACLKNVRIAPATPVSKSDRSYIGSRNGLAFSSKTFPRHPFTLLPGGNTGAHASGLFE